MSDQKLAELVGNTFCKPQSSAQNLRLLHNRLACGLVYRSDYAKVTVAGREAFLKRTEEIVEALGDSEEYTYDIKPLAELLKGQESEIFDTVEGVICTRAVCLYHKTDQYPVGIIVMRLERERGQIAEMKISRDTALFRVVFRDDGTQGDSTPDDPDDLPDSINENEIRRFNGRESRCPGVTSAEGACYIWEHADAYARRMLADRGYEIEDHHIFEDCVGYQCRRQGVDYTVYLFARGKGDGTKIDGALGESLAQTPFSESRVVLLLALNVHRFRCGGKRYCEIRSYNGKSERELELWQAYATDGQYRLLYFPRMEMIMAAHKLVYAFNHRSEDAWDALLEDRVSYAFYDQCGAAFGDPFQMHDLQEEYGKMRLGLVRYNDVIYSIVPYLKGYGFFSFRCYAGSDRINSITSHPFCKEDYEEFVKLGKKDGTGEHLFAAIPRLTGVEPLPSADTQRFALRLTFSDGECRRYVLPIDREWEEAEAAAWKSYVFTQKIWESVRLSDALPAEKGCAPRGPGVSFVNGCTLSGNYLYARSTPYIEPVLCGETVFEDEQYRLKRLWKMRADYMDESEDAPILSVCLTHDPYYQVQKHTFVSIEGKRLSPVDLDRAGTFAHGVASVERKGWGKGYIKTDMQSLLPMRYGYSGDFEQGIGLCRGEKNWMVVHPDGRCYPHAACYLERSGYSEGLCAVNTLDTSHMEFEREDREAGLWGYVDDKGREVIAPQYLYAEDFRDGLAAVAKGEWQADETGIYRGKNKVYGVIDRAGRTVIPFRFEHIVHMRNAPDPNTFGVCEKGKWGLMDSNGNWMVAPRFGHLRSFEQFEAGLMTFCSREKKRELDRAPEGAFDIKAGQVIVAPREYGEIILCKGGRIIHEFYDEATERRQARLLDREGRELLPGTYDYISFCAPCYYHAEREENGKAYDCLVDQNGKTVLPFAANVAWYHGIRKRVVVCVEGKRGVRDFDGNEILPPLYECFDFDGPFLVASREEGETESKGLFTHEGKPVLPTVYHELRWIEDHRYLLAEGPEGCEVFEILKKI